MAAMTEAIHGRVNTLLSFFFSLVPTLMAGTFSLECYKKTVTD